MKVAITGATGFIGRRMITALESSGIEYVIITRDPKSAQQKYPRALSILEWNIPATALEPNDLEGLDGVIHMAGAPVARRWTATYKRMIEESRVFYTRALVEALVRANQPPSVLISFSAIGYYGMHDDTRLNETSLPGTDFLAGVCQRWEGEANKASAFGIRVVNLRVGIVIGQGGGALTQMLLPFKLGVGGKIGDGQQWMSWVHVSDVVGLTLEALTNTALDGPLNATAPEPVTNYEFSKALGHVVHRPAILPIPVLGLKLLFGGFAEILATGQRVVPQKALALDYNFRFPDLKKALADAV